jgi:hypothetical protein
VANSGCRCILRRHIYWILSYWLLKIVRGLNCVLNRFWKPYEHTYIRSRSHEGSRPTFWWIMVIVSCYTRGCLRVLMLSAEVSVVLAWWQRFDTPFSKARNLSIYLGRAIAQAVSRQLPNEAARVQTRVWSCGILSWTKVALGQVFSENFGFPCQSTFHLLLHNHLHYHPRLAQ